MRLVVLAGVSALATAGPTATTAEAQAPRPRSIHEHECVTVEQCIAALRTTKTINLPGDLERRFESLGEAIVEPLLQIVVEEPDAFIRHHAGHALRRAPSIDPRHLPTLIAEDRKGDRVGAIGEPGWLAIPIGLVRDNPQALAYLFDLAEAQGLRASTNSVEPGILRSSDVVWLAEARRRLESFGPQQSASYLIFLEQLVHWRGRGDGGAPPEWLETALVRIASDPATSAEARAVAEDRLRPFGNPIALAALLREARVEFAAIPAWDGRSLFLPSVASEDDSEGESPRDFDFDSTIWALAQFGAAAREAGPLLAPFLSRWDLPDSRAEAALALGAIGEREAIPALIAAARDPDDWLVAYNATESLANLQAGEARGTLLWLARRHWSQAVRHNAERALNRLNGGAFERPSAPGDGKDVNDTGDEHAYFGPLRYAGDRQLRLAKCLREPAPAHAISQAPIGAIRFPQEGAVEIVAEALDGNDIPKLPEAVARQMPGGRVTVIQPVAGGLLAGTDFGEFGGALAYASKSGEVTPVVPDNVSLTFRHGGRLYVLTGLTHIVLSHGAVWQVDDTAHPPRAMRRIRLPAEAGVVATARGDLAFVTSGDAFLLRPDGTLASGDDEGTCRPPQTKTGAR